MKNVYLLIVIVICLVSCNNETKKNNEISDETTTDSQETSLVKEGKGVKDVEGNVYKTIVLGDQEWMASNLKTSKYNDGTTIPNEIDDIEWEYIETPAWCYYNNDSKNNNTYGKLYNWYALSPETNGDKNVCPSGWHVPTTSEWNDLVEYLGGNMSETVGGDLKESGTKHWKSPNTNATNASLFTALPAGYRQGTADQGGANLGQFLEIGNYGSWWSATESNAEWSDDFSISYDNGYANVVSHTKDFGFSVRCLKD